MKPEMIYLILGMSLVTQLPRLLPLVVLSRLSLPPIVIRWLKQIPVAVLSACFSLPSLLLMADCRFRLIILRCWQPYPHYCCRKNQKPLSYGFSGHSIFCPASVFHVLKIIFTFMKFFPIPSVEIPTKKVYNSNLENMGVHWRKIL